MSHSAAEPPTTTAERTNSKQQDSYNIFRDSPLRLLGYANEIGESFRYQLPRFVVPSYIISFGYCGMDSISAGYQEWNRKNEKGFSSSTAKNGSSLSTRTREYRSAIAVCDTLLWQTLASVLIPGGTINGIVRLSRLVVSQKRTVFSKAPMLQKWFPTFTGIASIPFIVHPIDTFVDYLLDNTTRAWINNETEKEEN